MAYGLFGVWSRIIGESFGPFSQNWVRNIVLLLIYGVALLLSRKLWKRIRKADIKWLILWGLSGTSTTIFSFIVFNHLPIGTTYIIIYSATIMGGWLVGWIFFKEKMNIAKIVAFALVVAGLFTIFSFSIKTNDLPYLFMGLLSGSLTGFWTAFSKKISGNYSSPQMLFIDAIFGITIALFGGLIVGEDLPSFKPDWGWLAIVGFALTNVVGSNFIVLGFRFVEAQIGSLLMPMEIVFAIVFGFIVFGEKPSFITLVGGGLIILASIIANLSAHEKSGDKKMDLG
ncbi:EamA family transporter [Candidatus Dojkabacteria bacterium]|nr:EamA family transporter [Candidatus Dojkabacteria bacterium]